MAHYAHRNFEGIRQLKLLSTARRRLASGMLKAKVDFLIKASAAEPRGPMVVPQQSSRR
jgi:hypothetical protein